VLPTLKQIASLLSAPRYRAARGRVVSVSAGAALLVLATLLLLPVPLHTTARGIVWLPEGAQVRAGTDAFVTQVVVASNTQVKIGDALVLAHDPLLYAHVARLEAELRALRARHYDERVTDLVEAQLTEEEIATAEAALARALQRSREFVIRSPSNGELVLPRTDDLLGRFVQQGEVVGYVIGAGTPTAKVVIGEADAALVRERTEAVEVRLARRIHDVQPARIDRIFPAATDQLPSRALGSSGGGEWAVDTTDPGGLRTLVPVVELDLALPESWDADAIGEAVYVRFDHGMEPLALRVYRGVRRLLLSRLSV
jgi:putative peptide zinc metalloprotease protein